MTVPSGFKGSCDYYNKPGHKKVKCFKFLRESVGASSSSSGAARSTWCSFHNTNLHENAGFRLQQQQRANGWGGGNNDSG